MQLSFIIPTYNRKEILTETLVALSSAIEGVNAEVIVVNDGILFDSLPVKNDHFFLLNNNGKGVSAARNMGARQAKSSLLVFLDDDMLLSKKNVEAIIRLHSGNLNKSYTFDWQYPPELMDKISGTIFGRYLIKNKLYCLLGWRGESSYWDAKKVFRVEEAAAAFLVVHKELFDRAGGFNENFPGYEDYDLSKRLAALGLEFYIDPSQIIYHNESDRITLNDFLKRRYRGAVARRLVVNSGKYPYLALQYSFLKKVILRLLITLYPVIRAVTNQLPNKKGLDKIYQKLVNILTAIVIYKGYNA